MCLLALNHDFFKMVKLVPQNLYSAEIEAKCLEEVKKSAKAISRIPEHFRTTEMGLIAVKESAAHYLKDVPENIRTTELYFEAIKQDVNHFNKMPDELKTAEMCVYAVKAATNSDSAIILKNVPENFKTQEMCLEAVKKTSAAIEFVPENFKTPELLEEARKGGYVIPMEPVKPADISSMDGYMNVMIQQIKNSPPEAREAILNALPAGMREQVLKALG
jgi:hypothetical protein